MSSPSNRSRPAHRTGGTAGARIRLGIAVVLVAAIALVVVLKTSGRTPSLDLVHTPPAVAHSSATHASDAAAERVRLVDLGADRCIPCKAMAPILVELRHEYAGVMQVDFIDVWKNPDAGDLYQVSAIPTQVFYDPSGRELYRHQGFLSKDDILATWRRLGVTLSPTNRPLGG